MTAGPLQTIRAVQPDVVVVELCQYRVSMLKMDERTLLREAKEISLEKLQQAVRQVRRPAPVSAGPCHMASGQGIHARHTLAVGEGRPSFINSQRRERWMAKEGPWVC